jgi:hypothetical protein
MASTSLVVCGQGLQVFPDESHVDLGTWACSTTSAPTNTLSYGAETLDQKMGSAVCSGVAFFLGTRDGASITAELDGKPPLVNPNTDYRTLKVQCAAAIGSAATLTNPVGCNLSGSYEIPYGATNPPGGVGSLQFGARLIAGGDSGDGDPPPAVTVSVDCGAGSQALPINAATTTSLTTPNTTNGGDCAAAVTFDASLSKPGFRVHRLEVFAYSTPILCQANAGCLENAPETPLCSPLGTCQAGVESDPCAHDSQCNRSHGFFCSSTLVCTQGNAGAACANDLDCKSGHSCVSNVCQ